MRSDGERFGLTIAANMNWESASWVERIAAWVFGRHERYEHRGWSLHIGWWRGTPFLLSIKRPVP